MNAFQEILREAAESKERYCDPCFYREELYPHTWRGAQWCVFAQEVLQHVESYTVPQYSDMPDDQASEFTIKQMAEQIKRYCNRVGRNARGPEEARRDMLKVAHYSAMIYAKMVEQEES